jgi:hypothetical protein
VWSFNSVGTSGRPGCDSRQVLGCFLFNTKPIPALGLTQNPWVLGVERPGFEADHSPSSIIEVKNAWSYTFTPPIHLHAQGLLYLYFDIFLLTQTEPRALSKVFLYGGGVSVHTVSACGLPACSKPAFNSL